MAAENHTRSAGEVHLVACGILRDELSAVLSRRSPGLTVTYLAPAPCIDQRSFPDRLARALAAASAAGGQVIAVIGACHPGVDEALARYGAQRLPMTNCFDALLGAQARSLLVECNTFFTTPAWLKHWRRALRGGMRWDQAETRQQFARYERVLLLDAGVTAYTPEQVLQFFDYVQVAVEILPVDLSNLERLLREALGS